MADLTLSQRKALAITPKFSGLFSMLGSSIIIRDVIMTEKHKTSTYHRLLLGMSTIDAIASFWFFMSTWPIPVGSPLVWGAIGNQATCTLQASLGQLSVGTPIYSASLALFYLLMATFRWNEDRIRTRVEPFMHLIPISVSIGTAAVGIPLKLYNNSILWCWYAAFPLGCKESFVVGKQNSTCLRGDNASLYRLVFWFGPIWLVTIGATAAMISVYFTVLCQERSVDVYNLEGLRLRKQSRRIAAQASWYLLAFYFTFTPSTLGRVLEFKEQRIPFGLLWAMSLVTPSQGLFNCLVYVRAKYMSYRRASPNATTTQILRLVGSVPRNQSFDKTEEPKGATVDE